MILKQQKHSIYSIFILLLLLLFTIFAVIIIAFGSRVYEESVHEQDAGFSYRTSFAYLTEKIRQSQEENFIEITKIQQTPVLCLYSEINQSQYVTYLYEYDGYLMEYFTASDLDFSLENGQKISPIRNLNFQIDQSLLQISFEDAACQSHSLCLFLHNLEAENGNF